MKGKTTISTQRDSVTKKDLQTFRDEIVQQFHIISEGLMDQIKLLAEGHSGIIQRLDRIEEENKHEHLETRALMEPHGQSPWYLHEIPSYAKASEGYPPVATSAGALILR